MTTARKGARLLYLFSGLLAATTPSSAQSLDHEGPAGPYLMFSGLLDVALGRTSNQPGAGARTTLLEEHASGSTGSIVRWRGREDLGDGLYGGFWLEGALLADTGTVPAPFWNRASAVYLGGSWGEIALGELRSPTYTNIAFHDPVGNNGYLAAMKLVSALGSAVPLFQNVNAFTYFLPDKLGGFYGHVQLTAGEGQANQRYRGFQFGHASDSFDLALAHGVTQTTSGSPDFRTTNLAGAVNMGGTRLFGILLRSDYGSQSERMILAGLEIPVGADQIKLSYSAAHFSGGLLQGSRSTAPGLQLVHFLNKRTGIYASAIKLRNVGHTAFKVGPSANAGSAEGGTSTGFDAGIRMAF